MVFFINQKAITNEENGRNKFSFRFNPVLKTGQNIEKVRYTLKPTVEPYAWNWNGTRDGLLHGANGYGCADNSHNLYCAKLIQYDGWEIKDDYPIKF